MSEFNNNVIEIGSISCDKKQVTFSGGAKISLGIGLDESVFIDQFNYKLSYQGFVSSGMNGISVALTGNLGCEQEAIIKGADRVGLIEDAGQGCISVRGNREIQYEFELGAIKTLDGQKFLFNTIQILIAFKIRYYNFNTKQFEYSNESELVGVIYEDRET